MTEGDEDDNSAQLDLFEGLGKNSLGLTASRHHHTQPRTSMRFGERP
jgi:hypothetical protein